MSTIFKNTTIYTLGTVIPKIASFIFLPIYLKYLTPSEYGIVASMQVLQTILVVFFTLCLERSILRLYWDYKTKKDQQTFLGTIYLSILIFSVFFLCLVLLFRNYFQLIYESIDFNPYYLITIFITFFYSLITVPKIYLMLEERAKNYIILSLSEFFLINGLIFWFVVYNGENASGYLKGYMFGALIIAISSYFIISKKIIYRIDKKMFKSSFSFSFPLIPTIIIAWVLNLSDRIFLERYYTLEEVGIYSLAYKIAGLAAIVSQAFGTAFSPVYFRLANSEDQVYAKKILHKYINAYLVVLLFICFSISFFAKEGLQIFFSDSYHSSYLIIGLISFSYLFVLARFLSLSLQQSKKMKQNLFFAFVAVVFNILLNFLLVPDYGMYGAAIATIISFIIPFFIQLNYTKKHCYFVPINWKLIVMVLLAFVGLYLIFLIIEIQLLVSIVVKLLLFGVLSFFILKKYYPSIKKMFMNNTDKKNH